MSTYIIGFKPKDEKYHQMKAIHDACIIANVSLPKEVYDYFGDYEVDDAGIRVDKLPEDCSKEWGNEYSSGIEVDISKLPKDIKIIRFVNSW